MSRPRLHSWVQINLDEERDVRTQIQCLIREVPYPWRSVELISPSVEIVALDVLQQELDDASCLDGYRTACLKCLRMLSKARNIVPSSFVSRDVTREGANPIGGGGFADIWKGNLHDTQVCLKVLRVFISGVAREKLLRDFCQEALVWRQLHHPNVLPFLGVSEDLFAPSYCLISPWMVNGNIISYLETHPGHDRLTSLVQIAEGMKYLHNHDPPIVHADIREANILVMDDLRCCMADFGLSLFAESQVLDSSSRMKKGSLRWLAPEYMDSAIFDQSYMTARDIYAYGCTIIEIFTGKPPFSDIKNEAAVIHAVLTKQSRPPRPSLDIFPNGVLWSLVTECLATVPSQRPDATYILGFLVSGIPYPLNRDRLEHPLITTLLGSRDSDQGLFPGIDVPGGGEFFLSPDLLQYERPPTTSETIIHQKLSTQTTPSSRKRRQSSSLEVHPPTPTSLSRQMYGSPCINLPQEQQHQWHNKEARGRRTKDVNQQMSEERAAAGASNGYFDRRTAAVMDATGVPSPKANGAIYQTNISREEKRRRLQEEMSILSEKIVHRQGNEKRYGQQEMMQRQQRAERNTQNEQGRMAKNNAATSIPTPPALPPSLLTMHETTSPPPPMTMPVLSTSSQTFNASSSSQPRAYPTARFPVSSASAHNTATFYRQLPQLPPIPSPSCYSSLPTARLASSSAPPADPLWTSDDVAADFFQLNIEDEPRMMPLESTTPYEGDSTDLEASSYRRARQTQAAPSQLVYQPLIINTQPRLPSAEPLASRPAGPTFPKTVRFAKLCTSHSSALRTKVGQPANVHVLTLGQDAVAQLYSSR